MHKAVDGTGGKDLRTLLTEASVSPDKSLEFLETQINDTKHGAGLISSGIISLVRSDAGVAELYLQVMQNAGTATSGEVMDLFGQDPSLSAAFLSSMNLFGLDRWTALWVLND
ncbi:hypothetical protein IV102_35145 [bacterium]|nr:hypothetical protein [bacterium]